MPNLFKHKQYPALVHVVFITLLTIGSLHAQEHGAEDHDEQSAAEAVAEALDELLKDVEAPGWFGRY